MKEEVIIMKVLNNEKINSFVGSWFFDIPASQNRIYSLPKNPKII